MPFMIASRHTHDDIGFITFHLFQIFTMLIYTYASAAGHIDASCFQYRLLQPAITRLATFITHWFSQPSQILRYCHTADICHWCHSLRYYYYFSPHIDVMPPYSYLFAIIIAATLLRHFHFFINIAARHADIDAITIRCHYIESLLPLAIFIIDYAFLARHQFHRWLRYCYYYLHDYFHYDTIIINIITLLLLIFWHIIGHTLSLRHWLLRLHITYIAFIVLPQPLLLISLLRHWFTHWWYWYVIDR